MGIKNLHKLFERYSPNIYKTVNLSLFAYKCIAIDISLYLFKYKTIFGDAWLTSFVNLVLCLRKNDIHCIFIYDGKPPPEKELEKEKRQQARDTLHDKMNNLKKSLDVYHSTGEMDELLRTICEKPSHKLLRSTFTKSYDISLGEQQLKKLQSQIVNITKEDIILTKELFDHLTVPYLQADGEAETLCSHLVLRGFVDGVLSEDTDVLAYGTQLFLTKINISSSTCVVLVIEDILDELEMSYKEFLDICIMCGNDYNKNIPKIGFVNSFNLIKEHGNIENIAINTNLDTSILNYKRTRELFTLPDYVNEKFTNSIKNCAKPDFDKLNRFLHENNCRVNFQNLKNAFQPKEFIFED